MMHKGDGGESEKKKKGYDKGIKEKDNGSSDGVGV